MKRHPIKLTASIASLYLLNKFKEYAATDHFEGQNVLQGVSQTLYWILREQLGLVESSDIPFTPDEITKEKVQACLQDSGTIKTTTKIKLVLAKVSFPWYLCATSFTKMSVIINDCQEKLLLNYYQKESK